MKLNTRIPERLKVHFDNELTDYHIAISSGNCAEAWRHLERAHIIGQNYPVPHSYVHWLMLRFGIKIKDSREIVGQIPRLFFGGIKSFIGRVPLGNTGGANVPILEPMEIPEDLKRILKTSRK